MEISTRQQRHYKIVSRLTAGCASWPLTFDTPRVAIYHSSDGLYLVTSGLENSKLSSLRDMSTSDPLSTLKLTTWLSSDNLPLLVNHLCDPKTIEKTRSSIRNLNSECHTILYRFLDLITSIKALSELSYLKRMSWTAVIEQLPALNTLHMACHDTLLDADDG